MKDQNQVSIGGTSTRELIQQALRSNKLHQQALTAYSDRLSAELESLDKILSFAEYEDDEQFEAEVSGIIHVPGAKRPVGPIASKSFVNPDSPFYEDASKRARYFSYITAHPMKHKELDALSEGVKAENYRKYALEAQQRGQQSLNFDSLDPLRNTEGLDWERIAEKVSEALGYHRTARECQIRWLGDRHPQINHEYWTPEELESLIQLASEQSGEVINWAEVSKKLDTHRTPIDCMRHAYTKPSLSFDAESDTRLIKAVQIYGNNNWNLVATYVSDSATPAQCQARYTRTLDPHIKRGTWTAEEDKRLRLAVASYGCVWVDVAAAIPGRTNEQCRDRWSERLDPKQGKGDWTEEEDRKLIEAVDGLGRSWKAVGEHLGGGRTLKQCRARYIKLQRLQAMTAEASPAASVNVSAATCIRPSSRQTQASSSDNHHTPSPEQPTRPSPEANPIQLNAQPGSISAGVTVATCDASVNNDLKTSEAIPKPPRPPSKSHKSRTTKQGGGPAKRRRIAYIHTSGDGHTSKQPSSSISEDGDSPEQGRSTSHPTGEHASPIPVVTGVPSSTDRAQAELVIPEDTQQASHRPRPRPRKSPTITETSHDQQPVVSATPNMVNFLATACYDPSQAKGTERPRPETVEVDDKSEVPTSPVITESTSPDSQSHIGETAQAMKPCISYSTESPTKSKRGSRKSTSFENPAQPTRRQPSRTVKSMIGWKNGC